MLNHVFPIVNCYAAVTSVIDKHRNHNPDTQNNAHVRY